MEVDGMARAGAAAAAAKMTAGEGARTGKADGQGTRASAMATSGEGTLMGKGREPGGEQRRHFT